ncbi:MAG: acylase [bacterium]|nr:MAG: acylase [bacterium]
MNDVLRRSLGLGLLLLFLTAGSCGPGKIEHTEILWDTWGVPHICGADDAALLRAFGWAQMHSHGDLVLRLYGQSRARGAEYWGEGYLEADKWCRTMGLRSHAHRWYEEQEPEFRALLDAFTAGINDYAARHADLIDDEVEVVLPVHATDVLAHAIRLIHFTFVTDRRRVQAAERGWRTGGSNAWAIAPSRSESGAALLLANPHLPWHDLFLLYEAHLVSPKLDCYGVAPVGLPVFAIAFNGYLGWTLTISTNDCQDLYELALEGEGYRYDGTVRDFETVMETITVKQADGTLRSERFEVRRSVHGPIVTEMNGAALALRVVGLERSGMLEQFWRMCRACDLGGFERHLKRLELPLFNVTYADRDGHIMHLFGGQTPVRPAGVADWSGVVAGDTSATLWTSVHPYEDLPRVVDPPSGWLQNANDPPWTTTFPAAISPDDFPPYMAPRFMHLRAQRSARMIREDESIGFEEMIAYKHSTRMELADRILDDLIPAARSLGEDAACRAADVLESWDRCADAESRGAVLFEAFRNELFRRFPREDEAFGTGWSEEYPMTTPDGLSDPAAAVRALEAAARAVEEEHGSLDIAWGDLHRFRGDGLDLPANGGPQWLGIFREIRFGRDGDGLFSPRAGDSYVCAVEFSDPIRAMALLSYGNASQPGSPHRTDQLPLLARKELRPVWLSRGEIEAHLELHERF